MNANELADELDKYKGIATRDAATMLRQQQAEIEALKLQLHTTLTNRDLRTYDGKTEMNNEPVAWRNLCVSNIGEDSEWIYNEIGQGEPLYTHPVKELSETRIKQIFVEQTGFYFDHNPADDLALMDFAKALLLEAQEK